jgi:hypothetical protein
MKALLTTGIVLALCAGLSGCSYPGRHWWGDLRDNGYWPRYGDRSGRDCSTGDNHWHCRGGDRY